MGLVAGWDPSENYGLLEKVPECPLFLERSKFMCDSIYQGFAHLDVERRDSLFHLSRHFFVLSTGAIN